MIQHKKELNRPMATEPILRKIIDSGPVINGVADYNRIVCKQFREGAHPKICQYLDKNFDSTYILFPSKNCQSWCVDVEKPASADLESRLYQSEKFSTNGSENHPENAKPAPNNQPINLIILDGTWRQANSIYVNSEFLQKFKSCKIVQPNKSKKSEYVIRMQPTEASLCTLEATGLALHYLGEDLPYQTVVKPLKKLCDIQLSHGAETHNSKQYLVAHGKYKFDLPQSDNRKLNNMKKLVDDYFQNYHA